ncbi:MAG: hypothetical protein PHU62_10135, partial [Bacteroidales bacterium]|nr:hypothetical protein [Bacteroidales bacterium]MDD4634908.1 hypothetical protein [Bacteroidales bacterium]
PITSIIYELSGVTTGTGTSLNGVTFNYGTTTVTWTVTNAAGSNVECSYTVIVNNAVSPTAIPEIIKYVSCIGGSDGIATVNVIGGAPELSYSWNTVPEQTTQTAENLSEEIYTVTVTDAVGRSTTATVDMTTVEHLPATELTASIYDYTTIRLSWTASASPYLNGYNVYRDGVL